jgi:hypothetical protein
MLNEDLTVILVLLNSVNYRMPRRVSQIGLNITIMPNQLHLSCHLEKYLSLKELLMIIVIISTNQSWNGGRCPCNSRPR